jgi:hypothetical protein
MRIVIDEREQRLVALVRHMHTTGLSMKQIVTELRAMGVVRTDGKPMRLLHVWAVLRSKPRPKDA